MYSELKQVLKVTQERRLIRHFERQRKTPHIPQFQELFSPVLLDKAQKWLVKSRFSYGIEWILQENKYICRYISLSWQETNGVYPHVVLL